MATVLGDPQFDPHGAPIPSKSGKVFTKASGPLAEMSAGERLVVVEVDDADPELLRYLGKLGIFPGTELTVLANDPFSGPLTLFIADETHSLGFEAALAVRVAPQDEQ